MAARPSWEGFLTFNLVSVPVKAFNAAAPGGGKIGFHLLHAKCGQRIRYKKVCPVHGEVANEEIVSGYEYAKGEYAVVPAGEKAKLKAKDDKAIDIDTFVPPAAIDPIYFSGRTYYLVPANPAAQKPYGLLMAAMAGRDRHAVARVVFSGRAQVAVVRPFGGVLVMTLLNFEAQVKPPAEFAGEVTAPAASAEERRLAAALMDSATTGEFDLARYKDDYAAKLAKLIEKKSHGAGRKAQAAGEPNGHALDLMDALRQSLSRQAGRARRRPARRAAAAAAPRRRKPGRRPRWRAAA
jgi:DNA end-binding protein Ku